MDIMKVVGISSYDFSDQQTGRPVKGWKYHFLNSVDKPNMQGYEVFSGSVSDSLMNKWLAAGWYVPELGDVVSVGFNRYGRLDRLELVENPGDLFAGVDIAGC